MYYICCQNPIVVKIHSVVAIAELPFVDRKYGSAKNHDVRILEHRMLELWIQNRHVI